DDQNLVAAVVRPVRQVGHAARGDAPDFAGDGGDPLRGGAAAAADDVDPAVAGEFAEHVGGAIAADAAEAAHAVGKAGVGVANNRLAGQVRQAFERLAQEVYADTAIEADGQGVEVGDGDVKRLGRLRKERPAAGVVERAGDDDRQLDVVLGEVLVDG